MGDWTFDNSFLFMGSMATTIGYGHIVPQELVINDRMIAWKWSIHAIGSDQRNGQEWPI